MYEIICSSLSRQARALALLHDLLEEEYQILLSRDTNGVAAIEFSIQELVRQLATEKRLVIRTLSGKRVKKYALELPQSQCEQILTLFAEVDRSEQQTSRQASRNAQLSLALLDQSTRNLRILTKEAIPNRATVYGRRGFMCKPLHPQATLISGRL